MTFDTWRESAKTVLAHARCPSVEGIGVAFLKDLCEYLLALGDGRDGRLKIRALVGRVCPRGGRDDRLFISGSEVRDKAFN